MIVFGQDKTGCISGDCENGRGVYVFENGEKYEGTFKDRMMNGYGKYYYYGGDTYEGEFKDHVENGLGIYRWADGYFFSGQFVNEYSNGYGIEYDETGQISKFGLWKENRLVDNFEAPVDTTLTVDSTSKIDTMPELDFSSFSGKLTAILNDATNSFASLKGEPAVSRLDNRNVMSSSLPVPGLLSQEIDNRDGKTTYRGIYFIGDAKLAENKLNKLITGIFAWMPQTPYRWTVDETTVDGLKAFVCTISGQKPDAKVNMDGWKISVMARNNPGDNAEKVVLFQLSK